MNGWERMIAAQREEILKQRVEISNLRIQVSRLERAFSGMFYRVTGAISFAHLVMGELPPPPDDPYSTGAEG